VGATRNAQPGVETGQINIHTLGCFKVSVGTEPLWLGPRARQKPLELLKLLIALGGEAVPVDSLVEALWPDLDGDRAADAFKTTLKRLRQLVGFDAVTRQGGRLSLHPERCWVDSVALANLCRQTRAVLASDDGRAVWEHAERILDLYSGPFLAGEYDLPEVFSARERLHGQYLRCLVDLAGMLSRQGTHQQVISLCQRALDADDLAEELYQELMRSCLELGRVVEGLAVYERCRQVLQLSVGADPSPDTEALRQALIARRAHGAAATVQGGVTPTKSVFAGPEQSLLTEERRPVTVVSVRVSTTAAGEGTAAQPGPQDALAALLPDARRIVTRHGGTLGEPAPHGIIALFGLPPGNEDDPVRAVRAALEFREHVRRDVGHGLPPQSPALRLHTGIQTGFMLVDPQQAGRLREDISGNTQEISARLAYLARPDEILIGPGTRRHVEPFFELETHRALGILGRKEPLVSARVVASAGGHDRFDAARRRGLSPWVGRQRELEVLLQCQERAAAGQGQVVTVIGAAGMGKSRLLYEFRKRLDAHGIRAVVGRCPPAGADLAYAPFVDLLHDWFSISNTDSTESVRRKAEQVVLGLDPTLESHLPALLHVLSVPGEHAFPASMPGEAVQRKVLAALKACIEAACTAEPLVMFVEDLHWSDANSAQMLGQFIEGIPARPVLLVLSYRPEHQPGWANYSYLSPSVLGPLSAGAAASLLASVLGSAELPEALTAWAHEHTEGNPLFVEELGLTLVQHGAVQLEKRGVSLKGELAELRMPDTMQAIIQARIDRLPEAARKLLRLGSVIGPDFPAELLHRLWPDAGEVSTGLGELIRREMIVERRTHPSAEYSFRHEVIRDVAAASLSRESLESLHRDVGRALVALYPERLPEYYERLAHHFDQGRVWPLAVTYAVKAGAKARALHLVEASLNFLDRAKEILHGEALELSWQVRFELHFERAQSLFDYGRLPAAFEEVMLAVDVAEREGRRDLLVQVLFFAALSAIFGHLKDQSARILARLRPLVAQDRALRLEVTGLEALAHYFLEHRKEALAKEGEFNELLRGALNPPYSPLATLCGGILNRWRGLAERTVEIIAPTLPDLKESASADLYMNALFFYGIALGEQGRFQDAIAVLQGGIDRGRQSGEKYNTPKLINSLGWVYHQLCLYEAAIPFNVESIEAVEAIVGPGTSNLFEILAQARINLGENHVALGRFEAAEAHLNRVLEDAKRPDYYFVRSRWKARLLLALGELWLRRGDADQAAHFLAEVRHHGWTDDVPYLKYQLRAARLQARIHSAENRHEAAVQEMRNAEERAARLRNPTESWLTRHAWGDVLTAAGQSAQAAKHYRAACSIVEDIAGALTDAELREAFRASRTVQSLRAAAEER
jgi:DNA-binding SARP family transcriptional activator/tetratricopeptide (TPR) repeat protein